MTDDSSRAADASRPNDVRWVRRPIAGWVVRAAAVVVPFIVSIGLACVLTAATPAPATLVPAIVRWVAIAAVSSLVLVLLERAGRRLMPIAALLDLTLVFPDRAPSRFRMALRTGTTVQLHRRVEEARTQGRFDTPAEAAERVIELVAALRVHDHITRGHSERVRAYTQMIADEMGLSDAERDRLRWAGLLHDVGKLLVPTSILNKQGRLTAEEYRIVQAHPENGRQLIEPLVHWLGESARAVWEHHEKWDGTGYPHGLAGEEISRAARIVAVADVYDVLTSARSYKAPVSPTEARAELARCAGTHFDPVVVRAFLNLSIGRVRRAAGPLSWLAQLTLFPTAVLSSGQAAGSAVVLTGALGASSAAIGPDVLQETFSLVDSRVAIAWHQDTAADGEVWEVLPPRSSTTTTTVSDGAGPFTSGELIAVGAVGAVGDDVGSGGHGSTTVPTTAPSTITPPSAGAGDEPDPAAGGGGTDSPPGAVVAPTTTTTTAVPATTPPPTATTIAPPTVTTPTVPPTTTPTVPPTTTPSEVDQPVSPTTTTAPAVPDPPGQGGTPPGHGGSPPGQGGSPPGQGGSPPGGGRGRTGG